MLERSAKNILEHPRYVCGEILGFGSQGTVVRVTDRERPTLPLVAKVGSTRWDSADEQLEGEFALLARTRAPGLVRVHDFARDRSGTPFLVEDYVSGGEPREWVACSNERLASLTASLADTLAALHEAGIAHGDIKPANVRITERGRSVLLDLGAAVFVRSARASSSGPFTEAFAAPELRAGGNASPATDLYALGATLWAVATGEPPVRSDRLRDRAEWVVPSLAAVIESLLLPHPADRPRTALDVVAALGRTLSRERWETAARGAHVREADVLKLLALSSSRSRVVYLLGPSGAGKSHVLREVSTRALLSGRACRRLRFASDGSTYDDALTRYLRGDGQAPWDLESAKPMLLLLDDLHAAPEEFLSALDAFRCRPHGDAAPTLVLAAVRDSVPEGAEHLPIARVERREFDVLCMELGVPLSEAEARFRESGGLPGWLVASLGRVPLSREAALSRLVELDAESQMALAIVATSGGAVPAAWLRGMRTGPLFTAGLLVREGDLLALSTRALASDLAEALSSQEASDRAATMALSSTETPAFMRISVARARVAPARSTELLAVAAASARNEGARSIEIAALVALVALDEERTVTRLARLERLTRDAGTTREHPQVLVWLEEAARRDAVVAMLASRRRAEERARAGDYDAARAHADRAIALAEVSRDRADRVYAHGTKGAVLLFAADWRSAALAFDVAYASLAELAVASLDAEEIARLHHNVGVVALYRDDVEAAIEAFERSIVTKRSLGDRAGVRACLMNLGHALARAARYDEALAALTEATMLATSLGQGAGRGWCLAALADLAVRRGRTREAEALVAEAAALGHALPSAVRADLVLLRAQIALAEGDATATLGVVEELDLELRSNDAMVDARALVLAAEANLALLPPDRRRAARWAIRGLRRARVAGLGELERSAARVLRRSRRGADKKEDHKAMSKVSGEQEEEVWRLLAHLAEGGDVGSAASMLSAWVLRASAAERVFVAVLDADAKVQAAWGVDVDGLAITDAVTRIDMENVECVGRRGAIAYQPEVRTRAGTGSRLVVTSSRSAVIVEHRFASHAFDHVSEALLERWRILADVIARTTTDARAASPPPALSSVSPDLFSTAVPRREPTREFSSILGKSGPLRSALAKLEAAIDCDLPVVIRGETGTGKELFARALHEHGVRRARPFVAVNCAAIADSLFEAELFGHARGAFTGADRARSGLLAQAEGGTLLLDEIGDLPLARQATLLRALEARRFRPVGSDEERVFDVRIVAATNRDLDVSVEAGTFRRDLLYRLRVLEIVVPPLRLRVGDVPILLRDALARAGSRASVTPAALDLLSRYSFPGNVRELVHLAQRLAATGVRRIDVEHLPRSIRQGVTAHEGEAGHDPREEVAAALSRSGGNISRAAALLGLSRHGFKKRMLRLGLRAKTEAT